MNNYFIPLNNGIFFLYIYFALVVDIKTFIFFFLVFYSTDLQSHIVTVSPLWVLN